MITLDKTAQQYKKTHSMSFMTTGRIFPYLLTATVARRDLSEYDKEKWRTISSSPVVREENREVEMRELESRLIADSNTLLMKPTSRVGCVCGCIKTSKVVSDHTNVVWLSL